MDRTSEQLIDLLHRMTRERDGLNETVGKLHEQAIMRQAGTLFVSGQHEDIQHEDIETIIRDAKRYRRLRNNWIGCPELQIDGRLAVIDSKIDALLCSEKQNKGQP